MIAADTSSIIAFLNGESGTDVDLLDNALEHNQLLLPPVVLTELLSVPKLSETALNQLKEIPMIELQDGFWERAGKCRSMILRRGLRARIADALIAQFCLDEKIALLTRDKDFAHYEKYCGLKLA